MCRAALPVEYNSGTINYPVSWKVHREPIRKGFGSSGLILGLRPANERRRYFIKTSLIDWAQT